VILDGVQNLEFLFDPFVLMEGKIKHGGLTFNVISANEVKPHIEQTFL